VNCPAVPRLATHQAPLRGIIKWSFSAAGNSLAIPDHPHARRGAPRDLVRRSDIYSDHMAQLTEAAARSSSCSLTKGRSYSLHANGHGAWEAVDHNVLSRATRSCVWRAPICRRLGQTRALRWGRSRSAEGDWRRAFAPPSRRPTTGRTRIHHQANPCVQSNRLGPPTTTSEACCKADQIPAPPALFLFDACASLGCAATRCGLSCYLLRRQ